MIQLREKFGGTWDGSEASGEIHGLVHRTEGEVKIELLKRKELWHCSVFSKGQCIAHAKAPAPLQATVQALESH